jgi:hypothetical protein
LAVALLVVIVIPYVLRVYFERFLKRVILSDRFYIVAYTIDTRYLPGLTEWVDEWENDELISSVLYLAAVGAGFYYRKSIGPCLVIAILTSLFTLALAISLVLVYMKCYPKDVGEYTNCPACSRAIVDFASGSTKTLVLYAAGFLYALLKPARKQPPVEQETCKQSDKV